MKAQIGTDENGNKFRVNPKKMHLYSNCRIEYRDVSEQEIVDLKIPEALVEVKIPIEVFMRSEEMQNKIRALDLLYNGLDRRTVEGYLYIEYIDTHDVPEYLSLQEYTRMKNAGVIFPPEIIAIYENNEQEQGENSQETPIDTVSENNDSNNGGGEVDNLPNEEE